MPISFQRFGDVDKLIAHAKAPDPWGKPTCPICGNNEFPCWEALAGHLKDQHLRAEPVGPGALAQHTDTELDDCMERLGLSEPPPGPESEEVRRGPGRPRKTEAATAA